LRHVTPVRRALAFGGIVGPAAFVGSWALAGAITPHYSPITDPISELAAVYAPTRVLMTTGFIVDGLGIAAFGLALRDELAGHAWIAAAATGAFTFAVAASPLRHTATNRLHATFAGLAYLSLVALPTLATRPIAASKGRRWAIGSTLAAAVSAFSLAVSTQVGAEGLWQRIGLTAGDVWIVAAAFALVARRSVSE
jgi:hypothetical membrane protein